MTLVDYVLLFVGAVALAGVLAVSVSIGIGIGVRRAERQWKELAKKWDIDLSRKSWTSTATLSDADRPAVPLAPTPVRVIEVVPAAELEPAALPAAVVPVQRPGDTMWGRHGSGELALQRPRGYVGRHRADRAIDVKGPITEEFERITGRLVDEKTREVAHVG